VARNVKGQLEKLLEGVEFITPAVFEELIQTTGASPDYLRRLLRQTQVSLHPLIEGVRQDTIENLARTLSKLAEVYAEQPKEARASVLESKRHTQLALQRKPGDTWRRTVLLHLNTWLENPAIYPIWAALQMKNAAGP
jgi:hypothetical protein